jgi:hypothetical protein
VTSTTTSWTDIVTALATVLAGVGTVGAVLVALFGQTWRERRRAPELSLEFGRNAGGMGWSGGATGPAEPVTLRVVAARGKRTARAVEVLLTASWTVGDESEYAVMDHYPLPWYRAVTPEGAVTRLDVAPGTAREVELLRIGRPMALYEYLGWERPSDDAHPPYAGVAEQDVASLEVAAFAVGHVPEELGWDMFLPDHLTFRLRLLLTAEDVDTVSYETKLRVVEEWWEGPPGTVRESEEGPVRIALPWEPLKRVDARRG